MAERTVRVVLQGDASSLIAAVNSARNSLNALNRSDTTRVQGGVRGAGGAATESASAFDKLKSSIAAQVSVGNLASQALTAAFGSIGGAIGSTVDAGMTYQNTLLNLQAITQSSGDTMAAVGAKARELGKDITIPGASAADAATAMTQLAKGGLSVADAMTAAKGTLQLAAAASIDAGKAAEIQVNAMNAFHLSADQAGHVADVLANVANAASGEMTDFAYGLTAAGATAHSFGISLEDTNTVLGLFANAGIKGEEGGTLLKTMLVRLAAAHGPAAAALQTLGVTAYDASGKFEGMTAVTDQLRDAHSKLTTQAFNSATAIAFGTRGIKGAAILGAEAASAFGDMSTAINRTGSASEIATAKMSGLWGSFENIKNQVQDLQLTVFGTFAPQLTQAVNAFASAIPDMAAAAMGAVGYVGSKVRELVGPIVDGIQSLVTAVAPYMLGFALNIKDGITTALDALAPFGGELKSFFTTAAQSGIIDALGFALRGVGLAFAGVLAVLGPIIGLTGDIIGFFSSMPGPVEAVTLALGAAILLRGPLAALFDTMLLGATKAAFGLAGAAVQVRVAGGVMAFGMDTAASAAKGLWAAMGGWVGVGVTALITGFTLLSGSFGDTGKSAESAKQGVDGLVSALQASNGVMDTSVRAAALQAIQQQAWGKSSSDLTTYTQNLGVSMTQLVDGLTGVKGAADDVESAYQKQKSALQAVIDANTTFDQNGQQIHNAEASRAQDTLTILDEQHSAYGALASASAGAGATAKSNNDAIAGSAAGAGAAVSGAAGSQDTLNSALASGLDPATLLNDALKDYKTQADFATTAGDFLWASLQEIAGNHIDAEHQTRLTAAAFRDMAASARGVTQSNTDLENATAKTADAQKKFDDLANHLGGTLDGQDASASNLVVTQAQVDQASRDLATAQNAEATAHDAVSKAQDTQFDAMTKAAQASVDQAGKAFALKVAHNDLKGATEDATAATEAARKKFIDTAEQMGYNKDDAEKLADKYGLLVEDVVTTFKQAGMDQAIQSADQLAAKLNGLDNKVIHYTVVGGQLTVENTTRATVGGGPVANADGGFIRGPGGPRDDMIPSWLSNGEFVVNAAATARHLPLLHEINAGRFAAGGQVTIDLVSQFQEANTSTIGTKGNPLSSFAAAAGNINYSIGAGVEQWRATVDQALAILGQPLSYDNIVLHQMDTESSGNPNAINLTDINAQNGVPSKGLVQVIDPTFRTYAVPPYNQNIWDPLSNILAGVNYAIHQYGSIPAGMRGVAYDNGGPIPPGYTMAYNGTGQTEWALTGAQMSDMSAMSSMTGAGSSQPINLVVSLVGDGPITDAALQAAQVTVNGALRDVRLLVNRGQGQS